MNQAHLIGKRMSLALKPYVERPQSSLEKDERFGHPPRFYEIRPDDVTSGFIRVGLIDPYAFTRECSGRALQEQNRSFDVRLFAELSEAQTARNEIDVLVLHWQGSDHDGDGSEPEFPVIDEAIKLGPVLILSNISDPSVIRYAFSKGVRGYVTTATTSVNLLAEIIRVIRAGGTFVPVTGLPFKTTDLPDAFVNDADNILTARERAVLDLLKAGKPNKIIAYELVMSESTVKVHVRSIMRKMNARNRTEAVSRAYSTRPANRHRLLTELHS
jgi:DNA-binding NarL/FixJ family response regulator